MTVDFSFLFIKIKKYIVFTLLFKNLGKKTLKIGYRRNVQKGILKCSNDSIFLNDS